MRFGAWVLVLLQGAVARCLWPCALWSLDVGGMAVCALAAARCVCPCPCVFWSLRAGAAVGCSCVLPTKTFFYLGSVPMLQGTAMVVPWGMNGCPNFWAFQLTLHDSTSQAEFGSSGMP